jgi:prevent-host-death family protein
VKTIGLFEAKAKLSELCTKVSETGEIYTITRRGKPLVKLVAVTMEPDPSKEFRHLSIGEARSAYEAKYGPITEDVELPPREMDSKRKNPLED